MGKIVIKKRVSFDFLGDEYKECYADFQRIPVSDFDEIQKKMEAVEKDKGSSFNVVLDVLKKYFVSGKFLVEDKLDSITAEDLDGLDADSTLKCFQIMTGQELDPKGESPSTSPSSTEDSTTA
jgi:hypothetical protein